MEQTSTILIVDDEPTARDMLEMLLSNQGYELASASNGPEALALAAQLMPDVILLDIMMPDMDGFEVCERLRADPTLAKVPVLMVTALDDRDSRLRGIESGADDFISKPYDRFELRARLRTITKLNRYRRLFTEHSKFEWVVEKADDGFLILNDNEQIVYANPQARLYLNISTHRDGNHRDGLDDSISTNAKEDIAKGKINFLELARKQYHCEPQEAWTAGLTAYAVPRYLVRPESPNAHAFWLQADLMEISTELDEKYLIRLRDVTEKISTERVRWTFQGQINHKLRSPLMPITGGLEYLQNNLSQLSEKDLKEFLDVIYQGASRLQNEIEAILKYLNISKINLFEWHNCHFNDILSIITSVKDNLEIESVFIKKVFEKDEEGGSLEAPDNIHILISNRAMELILRELFLNAKKFHPNGSPTLDINITMDSQNICLQVCDDGLRLSPEQLAKIWTPYYQGEKDFTGQAPGMGLGLSMVASLIWNVGGSCRAYNRQDKPGMIIEISLPSVISNQ